MSYEAFRLVVDQEYRLLTEITPMDQRLAIHNGFRPVWARRAERDNQ
jgi:hypothetical protein